MNDKNRPQWALMAEYVSRERIVQLLDITPARALELVRRATVNTSGAILSSGDVKLE